MKAPPINSMRCIVLFAALFALLPLRLRAAESHGMLSADPASRLSTVPYDANLARAIDDSGIADLAIRHEGWNETLASWSRLKLYELTGRTAIHGEDPVYSILSILYERERWYDAKILPVEHPRIAELLGIQDKWISVHDLAESTGRAKMQAELQEALTRKNEATDLRKLLDIVHQARSVGAERKDFVDSLAAEEQLDAARIRELVENTVQRDSQIAHLKELDAQVKKEKAFLRAGMQLFDRGVLFASLDEQFLLVPDPESPTHEWLSAAEARRLAGDVGGIVPVANVTAPLPRIDLPTAATQFDNALRSAFSSSDGSALDEAVSKFKQAVQRSRQYPSQGYLARKNFYTIFRPAYLAAGAYGVAAILFGLFGFFRAKGWRIAGTSALALGWLLQTMALALRLSLTGHMPVSNMYESIVFASWAALTLGCGLEIWKRDGMFGTIASIIGTLALMGVTLMPLDQTRIHPLRAVLNSYWLNIHVTCMLVSYGAFMISAFFAAGYLVKSRLKRDKLFGREPLMSMDQMETFAYRLVQVGWPILTVGVCLGGVWADTAWGRFWGWDPKETWALITWITYTIYLHTRMVMGWKGRVSAIACLIGFLMVLVTWIGVSYVPGFAGGLHTYASPT